MVELIRLQLGLGSQVSEWPFLKQAIGSVVMECAQRVRLVN